MSGGKKALAAVLVLAVIWVGWQLLKPAGQAEQSPGEAPGRQTANAVQAPDFTLRDLDGREVTLSSLKGKKVLVNFWTTWCTYCRQEMPLLQKFHQQNSGGWQVITVNMTASEKGLDPVRSYVSSNKFTFPVLLDEKGAVSSLYGVSSIPASLVLNEKGEVVKTKVGPFSEKELSDLAKMK